MQDPLRAGGADEGVGERAVHPLEDRGAQQQPPHLVGLPLEHLGQQVLGDGALAAGELGDEPLGLGMPASESAASRSPAAQPSVRAWSSDTPWSESATPDVGEQLPRLLEREAQIGGPHLGQLAGEAQAMQPELRVVAGRQHDAEQRGPAGEQALELRERLGRAQLVQVVDHQHDRLVPASRAAETRRSTTASPSKSGVGVELLDEPVRTRRRRRSCSTDGEPEPLRVSLAALDRHPGDVVGEAGMLDPRPKQDGLAAPGRGRDQRHATRHAG